MKGAGDRSLANKVAGHVRLHVLDPARHLARGVRNRQRALRPVFVAGAMGSGTTLLAVELWRSFDFAGLVSESANQVSMRSFLRMRPVAGHASVAAYLAALEPAAGWSVVSAREALLRLYRSRAAHPGTWVVDKGPNANLVRAGFLRSCFPDASFVLLFRDPVANVEGFRRKWPTFGREPLAASIDFYRRTHERFLEEAESFREQVVVVSYEGLVRRHAETLAVLATRLGLEKSSQERVLQDRPAIPGQGLRSVTGNRIELVQDADQRARLGLTEVETDEIRSRLGSLHRELLRRAVDP